MPKPLAKREIRSIGDARRVVHQIIDFIGELLRVPHVNGAELAVEFTAGNLTRELRPGLGRAVRGWLVLDTDAAVTIHRETTNRPTDHLTLTASAAANVKLWVF